MEILPFQVEDAAQQAGTMLVATAPLYRVVDAGCAAVRVALPEDQYATTCVRILQYLTSVSGGRKLSLRDVFTAVAAISLFAALLMRVRCRPQDSFSARRWRCNSY